MKSTRSKKLNQIPKIENVQFIQKSNGFIKGYSVNTFHGMVKNYNEDRVSIIMNITKPNYKGRWPKCSYFAIFDGHGGSACSDFLKDNMHKFITENQYFPHKPIQALKQGFKNAQSQFLKIAKSKNPVERSGSCALVLLVIDQVCYVANVGDSRAILSTHSGKTVYPISRDHKPDSTTQKSRIMQAGGNIYQSSIQKNGTTIYGPFRIQPGKLSVSRSFGDIEAKLPELGGNPKVLISKPQITYFTIDPSQHDFIMMGSDGIFDKLTNQQIIDEFWNLQYESLHQNKNSNKSEKLSFIGKASSKIITKAMENVSLDNLTTLFIVFDNQDKFLNFNSSIKENSCNVNQMAKQTLRSKSSAHQRGQNVQNDTSISQKFSLKRQISKSSFAQELSRIQLQKSYKQTQSMMKQKQYYNSHKQQINKNTEQISNKNFLSSNTEKQQTLSKELSYNSSNSSRRDQQNNQNIANRQPSISQYSNKNENNSYSTFKNNGYLVNQNQKNRFEDNKFQSKQQKEIKLGGIMGKSINKSVGLNNSKPSYNAGTEHNLYAQESNMGLAGMARKRSQGLLRKESKKESVWNTINKGLKNTNGGSNGNNDKVIEKFRY